MFIIGVSINRDQTVALIWGSACSNLGVRTVKKKTWKIIGVVDCVNFLKFLVTKMPPGRLAISSLESQHAQSFAPNMVTRMVTNSTPQHEFSEMALQSSLETRLQLEVRGRIERQLEVGTQPSLSPAGLLQTQATAASNVGSSRRKRGLTRGLGAQLLIDKEGKLLVPIPREFRAPVGIHASKLASKIGFEIRSIVKDLGVKKWKAVDDSVKSPLFQRLQDQFNIEGDPNDVSKAITTRCGRRLSDHTYRLHKKFNKLKETKGEGFARSHPPTEVTMEQWTNLIDEKWTNPIWEARSRKNTENMICLRTKHRCGSKSIPVRVYDYATNHNGELQNFPEFYKETHFNTDTNQWIAPECEANYDKMRQIEDERNQMGEIPLTQVQMSVEVLQARSGNVKGLGLRPTSTIRTICDSARTNECVTRLEMKIEEQNERLEAQNKRIEELLGANKLQHEMTLGMMAFLREKGYMVHSGNSDISSTN